MTTTHLERLLFVQGGLCFFCNRPLPMANASVEHLQASANGGTNHDDNCVACCKTLNRALGSMALKAKFQVVLNQKGTFQCPMASTAHAVPKTLSKPTSLGKKQDVFVLIVETLRQRGSSRPRTIKTLTSTIAALLLRHKSPETPTSLVEKLRSTGTITESDGKVSYAL
jgi:hypothetical protein